MAPSTFALLRPGGSITPRGHPLALPPRLTGRLPAALTGGPRRNVALNARKAASKDGVEPDPLSAEAEPLAAPQPPPTAAPSKQPASGGRFKAASKRLRRQAEEAADLADDAADVADAALAEAAAAQAEVAQRAEQVVADVASDAADIAAAAQTAAEAAAQQAAEAVEAAAEQVGAAAGASDAAAGSSSSSGSSDAAAQLPTPVEAAGALGSASEPVAALDAPAEPISALPAPPPPLSSPEAGSSSSSSDGGSAAPASSKAHEIAALKEQLVGMLASLDRGAAATADQAQRVDALARQLAELGGPVALDWVKPAGGGSGKPGLALLDGRWRLLHSSGFASGSLGGRRPGPSFGSSPFTLGQVYQDLYTDKDELDNCVELFLRFSLASLPGVDVPTPTAFARLRHTLQVLGASTVEITFTATEVTLSGGVQGWLGQLPTLALPQLPEWLQPPKPLRAARFEVLFLDEQMRITRGDRGELRVFWKGMT